MMETIYVLDQSLQAIGIIDKYKSLIWSSRYWDVGDCELYVPASAEMLDLLKINNYLTRTDDEMVCQIKKLELDTDAENGNYIVVTGYDTKRFLDQRIVWNTMIANGRLENFIRRIIRNTMIFPAIPQREIPNFTLGETAGFTERMTGQVSFKNVGEQIREYCRAMGWGYKVVFENDKFVFKLYKGEDRTADVIFADTYENISTTAYVDDNTNLANVALVAGTGEGADRKKNTAGDAAGIDRYEIYIDAKNTSNEISFAQLKGTYPLIEQGGQAYIDGLEYKMSVLDIRIYDAQQLALLRIEYPGGQEITIDGIDYYEVQDVTIADLPSADPQDEDTITLRDVVYSVYLLSRGYDELDQYGAVKSFEGIVEPSSTFKYKQDYFLGDLVTIESQYGISVSARITDIIEVNDDNGYSIEPIFQYIEKGGLSNG